MEGLRKRIDNLTAREINGVYKPLMEPGGNIEKAINGYTYINKHTEMDVYVPGIRDALYDVLDHSLSYSSYVYAAREKIYDLRFRHHNRRNNEYVSNSMAKGVADRAEAILNDIIEFKRAPVLAALTVAARNSRKTPRVPNNLPPVIKSKTNRKSRKLRKTRSRK